MVPYFGQIMEHLKVYLTGQLAPEEMALQTQALGNNIIIILKHNFNYFYYIKKTLLLIEPCFSNLFTSFSYIIYLYIF